MIQCEDLSKQFGDYWAVNGIDLTVQPGQVLALLGQNGAGKTTTVRMLTSVLAPTRGRAIIGGHDVTKAPEKVRAQVGVLTEQHGLYLRMSGKEYLDFFAKIYSLGPDLRKKRTNELLEYFGLAHAANQNIGQYSKGMRQKLALARTLIHEPPVLLLDEPTSAMDPESARLVRRAIAGLRSQKRTIIICTHNLVEAELLADHIAIIYQGRILIRGTVAELKQKILGPAEYEIRTVGRLPVKKLELPPGVHQTGRDSHVLRVRVDDPSSDNPRLIDRLIAQRISIMTFQEVPRTLEDVYLAAMKGVGDG